MAMHGDPWVAKPAGELDLDRLDEMRELVQDFRRSNAPDARLDLTAVTFMDSSALRVLLQLRQTATERGGTVTLVSPCQVVRRLLEVTTLDRLFVLEAESLDP